VVILRFQSEMETQFCCTTRAKPLGCGLPYYFASKQGACLVAGMAQV
jgi:hypothetical protein